MSRALGRALADAGQQTALAHAVDLNGDAWREVAMGWVQTFAQRGQEFRIEQARAAAEASGLPQPPSNRAWGAIASVALRRGLIRRVRWESCQNSKAHCAPVSVWIGA